MEKEREIATRIIDAFEELLAEYEIKLPNNERTGDEYEASIYGSDYYNLEDKITSILYEEREKEINQDRYIIMFRYFDRYTNEMKKVHINTDNLNDFESKLKELHEEYFTTIYEVIYVSENLFSNPKYKDLFEIINIKRIGEPVSVPNDCFFDLDKIVNESYQNGAIKLEELKQDILDIYLINEKDILKMNPNIKMNNMLFINLTMQSIYDGDLDKNFAPVDKLQSKYYEEDCEIL